MANQPKSTLPHAVRVCKYCNESNLDSYYWHPVLVQTKMSGTVPSATSFYLFCLVICLFLLFIHLVLTVFVSFSCSLSLLVTCRYQRKCLCMTTMTKYLLSKMFAGCLTSAFGTTETYENVPRSLKISSHLTSAIPFGSLDGCYNSTSIISAS